MFLYGYNKKARGNEPPPNPGYKGGQRKLTPFVSLLYQNERQGAIGELCQAHMGGYAYMPDAIHLVRDTHREAKYSLCGHLVETVDRGEKLQLFRWIDWSIRYPDVKAICGNCQRIVAQYR